MGKIRAWLDKQYTKELNFEFGLMLKGEEESMVGNPPQIRRLYLHVAHLRMLSKMAAAIMLGEFGLIIVLFILLIKKGVL